MNQKLSRRALLQSSAAVMGAAGLPAVQAAPSPFKPTWDSLVGGYRTPDWFRDAKFGIWAHWSAQCVPEAGDWYARQMYMQGNWQYDHHVKNYGHPTQVGFMEMNNRWKAENWDPEALMDLYAKAGAKYFVSLANHHDNFDAYDSKYHPWNSVRVGPKKDIVGTWAKVARAKGLRFGVSNHSAHAWHWFQTAYGYDAEGPLAGQRYDAFKLTKADGKGKWWEGLDPQDLYTGRNMVMHYYNASMAWHGGKLEAVLNAKEIPPEWRAGIVEDVERGQRAGIEPLPWQTDTCIGDWHYNRGVFEGHHYKSAASIIHRLVDIVSKNGNLLLSIPLRGDGTIDADERKVLDGLGEWMGCNGEAIHGTRPWRSFGEGPTQIGGGMFSENQVKDFTDQDIRFTTKAGALYAIGLAWPKSGVMRIASLAQDSALAPGLIERVEAVGSTDSLSFKRTPQGLEVKLPEGLA
ncbi:MAG: alpha-L-fucosidase, partial [Burkholderiales bacterium]|nr:alpha-L-fucosidase [Burkholderiales bacterium]